MKYCENCGAELEDSAVFCEECGAKVETVPQEKAVDSEQSKEAEKQDNTVIDDAVNDTSGKPVGKGKRMIPILCGAIGVLIIVVIVIIIVTVTSRKSNNDENNAKNDLETVVATESVDETISDSKAESIISTEMTTQEKTTQPTKSLTEKLTGTWLAQEEQKMGQYTCTVSLEMKVNSVDGSNVNIDLKFRRNMDSGRKYAYMIKGLDASIASGSRLEFDASKANLVLSNNPDSEATTLYTFQGKVFGTGAIQIDTTDDNSIMITTLSVYFVNDDFSLNALNMKKQ